ncbi:porin [Paraburkholderia sp.]|uniref:porin n=1 Tax=Paraburkholderia sp. TaxID=1926495 RepID=UPI00238EEC24|nr:porin [Paraburkholderia sp.]MDE1179832.1 porin [Paraburkholderia sp.]
MKKIALSSLSLALLGAAGVAHAQSSVTLYGLIDTGLTYSSNSTGHSNFQQASGILNGNRFGLRGSEDLGNGLKAVFVLENGFNLSNGKLGQNSRMFGRQAFVGLSSNQFGTVTMGRQYDSLVDNVAPLSLNGTQNGGTLASHPYDNDNLNNSVRINNAVKFQSVNYDGFKFGALYGFSNAAGSFADSRAYSLGASYQFGGLKVAAGYLQLNGAGSTTNTSGAVATSSDSTFTAARQRSYGAGINYAFGAANVGLVVTQTQLNGASSINSSNASVGGALAINSGSARFTNYEVNGHYAMTPAWTLSGAYTFTDASLNGASPKYHQVTLQSDYALSKRTDVYAEAAYQHVTGTGNSGVTAEIVGVSASSTDSQIVGTVGIRHRF